MDPRDRPRPLPDGAACPACGVNVPTARTRILARRDDVAFVELDCDGCGSDSLGLLLTPTSPDGEPHLDVGDDTPAGADGRPTVRPVTDADVEAIRRDLASWDGDLVGWLEALDASDRRGTAVDR